MFVIDYVISLNVAPHDTLSMCVLGVINYW